MKGSKERIAAFNVVDEELGALEASYHYAWDRGEIFNPTREWQQQHKELRDKWFMLYQQTHEGPKPRTFWERIKNIFC